MSILPKGYKDPTAEGNYMRFQKGENKLRILADPIFGWETWTDARDDSGKQIRKPLRRREDDPFSVDIVDDPALIKYFWALIVWNYQVEKVQILEITQKGD